MVGFFVKVVLGRILCCLITMFLVICLGNCAIQKFPVLSVLAAPMELLAGTKKPRKGVVADCPYAHFNVGLTCEPVSWGRGFGVVGTKVNDYTCPWKGYKKLGITGAGWCGKGFVGIPTRARKTVPKNNVPYSKSVGSSSALGRHRTDKSRWEWEKCGLLYYPKCPKGTKKIGCNICRGPGLTKGWNVMECRDKKYPNKIKLLKGVPRCFADCPKDYEPDSTGIFCKPQSFLNKLCKYNPLF